MFTSESSRPPAHTNVNEDANDGEDNLCKAEAHGNNVTDLHHSS